MAQVAVAPPSLAPQAAFVADAWRKDLASVGAAVATVAWPKDPISEAIIVAALRKDPVDAADASGKDSEDAVTRRDP